MGQKVNPNIFQLGRTKIWSSKYHEKKKLEASKYVFKDVELRKFILKFFNDFNLSISACTITLSENKLSIFVSYFINNNSTEQTQLTKKFEKGKTYIKGRKKLSVKKITSKKKSFLFGRFLKKFTRKKSNSLRLKKYYLKKSTEFLVGKPFLKNFCDFTNFQKKIFNLQLQTKFFNKLLLNLTFFFPEQKTLVLNFQLLNNFKEKRFSKKGIKFIESNLNKLRTYENKSFLKEGIQIIFLVLKYRNTVDLLTKYISKELQKHKKQHFFLNFIKKAFQIFNKKEFCTPKNIKIAIKGRFNGVSRSKNRVILIGTPISLISASTKVDYSQETSFSANGTFGIKTWISDDLATLNKQKILCYKAQKNSNLKKQRKEN